jgi:hypothetical protein
MATLLQLRFQEDSWCRLSFGDAAFPRVICEQASALSNPRTNAGGNKGADRSVSNGAPHAFDLGTNIHHLRRPAQAGSLPLRNRCSAQSTKREVGIRPSRGKSSL